MTIVAVSSLSTTMSLTNSGRGVNLVIGVLLCFCAAFSCNVQAAPKTAEKKFAVIVDAGSSGSRIYVYQYDSSAEVPNLEPIKDKSGKPWNYKVKPGISSFEGNLGGIKAYVQDLLKHLNDEVPESAFPRASWAKTPFMWFATAGMRLLSTQVADDITNKLRQIGHDKKVVPFQFFDRWARTLSGEEEGAFAWISLNYKNGLFTKKGVEDYGVVETGGASSQMTFLSRGNILSNKFNVIIDRKVYPLYTHSFLYFGQEQIQMRIFKNECLCKNSKSACQACLSSAGVYNGKPVKSACLISGYTRKVTINYNGVNKDIIMVGTGDPTQCALEMDYLFRADYDCFTKPCSFAGIYQPPFDTNKKFYGTSAIRYALMGLGMLKTTEEVTWPQVRAAADKKCSSSLKDLDSKNDYAWSYCLSGMFVAKEFEHLQFAKDHRITIESFDSWTVGAVLYQLELMEILMPGDVKKTRGQNNSEIKKLRKLVKKLRQKVKKSRFSGFQ